MTRWESSMTEAISPNMLLSAQPGTRGARWGRFMALAKLCEKSALRTG